MRPSTTVYVTCRLHLTGSLARPFGFEIKSGKTAKCMDSCSSAWLETCDEAVQHGMGSYYANRKYHAFMKDVRWKIKWVNDVPRVRWGVRTWPWLEFVPIAKESRKPTRRQSNATGASGLTRQGRSGASRTLG